MNHVQLIDFFKIKLHEKKDPTYPGIKRLTVLGVVGDEVVLDGEHVGEDDGSVGHALPELVASLGELLVEHLGDIVVLLEAAVAVEVTVVVPRNGQLLRQAAQRPSPVDPELPRTVRVQSLHSQIMFV
jgi:hypothetical protein